MMNGIITNERNKAILNLFIICLSVYEYEVAIVRIAVLYAK